MRIKLTLDNGTTKTFNLKEISAHRTFNGSVIIKELKPSWCPGHFVTWEYYVNHSYKEIVKLFRKAQQPASLRKRKEKRVVKI